MLLTQFQKQQDSTDVTVETASQQFEVVHEKKLHEIFHFYNKILTLKFCQKLHG